MIRAAVRLSKLMSRSLAMGGWALVDYFQCLKILSFAEATTQVVRDEDRFLGLLGVVDSCRFQRVTPLPANVAFRLKKRLQLDNKSGQRIRIRFHTQSRSNECHF